MHGRFKVAASVGAIAAMAALSLTGCSSGSGSTDGVTHITFWNSFTSDDKPAVEHIVNEFNSSHKTIHVDMTIQPDDVLQQKLLPAYSAGKGPTITSLDASQLPQYAKLGVIQPVDDVYSSGALDASVLPKASLDSTKYDGKQYGVPMAATSSMLYYNKKLFAAAGIANPPSTMAELATDATKLTKYTAGKNSTNQYGFAIPESQAISSWAVLLWSQGGDIVDSTNTKSELGSAATIKAAEYWNDLIQKDHIDPSGLNGVQGDSLFAAGRAAMIMNGPWASSGYKAAGIDFGVVPVPAGTAGQFANAVSVNMEPERGSDGSAEEGGDHLLPVLELGEEPGVLVGAHLVPAEQQHRPGERDREQPDGGQLPEGHRRSVLPERAHDLFEDRHGRLRSHDPEADQRSRHACGAVPRGIEADRHHPRVQVVAPADRIRSSVSPPWPKHHPRQVGRRSCGARRSSAAGIAPPTPSSPPPSWSSPCSSAGRSSIRSASPSPTHASSGRPNGSASTTGRS